MIKNINIYCDESCHLENDHINVMVLGAVWCPRSHRKEIFKDIRSIKEKHNLSKDFEIKWTKVSESKIGFYKELIDYFFSRNDLHFRALVIPDKSILRHKDFKQDHDTWYYKMYFEMLKVIIDEDYQYEIYADYKDTRGRYKINKLHEVLCNDRYDFSRDIIKKIQMVRSHEIEIVQITDLLIGSLAYLHRGLDTNPGKVDLINHISKLSGFSLKRSTHPSEGKFNVFIWNPRP